MPPSVIVPGPIAATGVDIPHGQSAGCLGDGFDPVFVAEAKSAPEPRRIRDAYGPTAFGRHCLLARRLVEAGVRVVTVNMFDTVFGRVSWDGHGASPFSTFDDYARELLPTFDRAFGALLDDLERTGRLDSTLVVAAGEFGRCTADQCLGRPGSLAGGLDRRAGGRRHPRRPGGRLQRRPRRRTRRPTRHPARPAGDDLCEPRHRSPGTHHDRGWPVNDADRGRGTDQGTLHLNPGLPSGL